MSAHVFRILIAAVLLTTAQGALAGRIVVAHDEWTFTDTGFVQSPDAGVFADNVARFFTGGPNGTFHAASSNFGLTGGSLAGAMSGAGHTWTVGALTFNLPTLLGFDGIFLAGPIAGFDANVLASYVNMGGNVYLAGGTGSFGSASAEAAFWDPFLNQFDLDFGSVFNSLSGNHPTQPPPHPIFAGVASLFEDNGNTISPLVANPDVSIYFDGRYAVYDDVRVIVAEPTQLVVWLAGLIALAAVRRRA